MRQGARLRGAILPRPEALPQRPAPWQHALRQAARSPHELLSRLGLEPADVALSADAARDFPLLVPQGFIDRMRPGDAADPLLRQVLPAAAETLPVPGFITDPLAEAAARAAPGILHKYAGRALLVLTGACAVHCRYCFRRHFPYQEAGLRPAALDQALAYLAADTTLHEVILSGGDPLTLADARLAPLADRLAALPALRTLRIHTRLPVVLPEMAMWRRHMVLEGQLVFLVLFSEWELKPTQLEEWVEELLEFGDEYVSEAALIGVSMWARSRELTAALERRLDEIALKGSSSTMRKLARQVPGRK